VSQLQTYESPAHYQVVELEGNSGAINLSPGSLVRHEDFEGTKGMLISNGSDSLVVLWSVPPPGPIFVGEEAMIRDIQNEIDADIISILRTQARAWPK